MNCEGNNSNMLVFPQHCRSLVQFSTTQYNSLFWTRNFAEGPWGVFEILQGKKIFEFTLDVLHNTWFGGLCLHNVINIKYSPHIEVLLFLGLKKEAFVAVFDFTHLWNSVSI